MLCNLLKIFCLFAIFGCSKNYQSDSIRYELNQEEFMQLCYQEEVGPIELLNYLKRYDGQNIGVEVDQLPKKWIGKKDIRSLIKYIDSQEPAAEAINVYESRGLRPDKSTVGNEALKLIEGYIDGVYLRIGKERSKEEIIDWWEAHK
ncbi:MAG: hypothetical protein IIA88_00565 [Bacteroidetes bacterium]|nr:hypothetical protein [Bacteroidota bacterium]